MKTLLEILIVLPTLAVITESAYEGFLPGIGSYVQPHQKLQLIVPEYASGALPSYKRPPRQTSKASLDKPRKPLRQSLDKPQRPPRQILDKPKDDPGSKCSYVQMKGSPIPGANCQAGGMACDKECALVDVIDHGKLIKALTKLEGLQIMRITRGCN